MRGFWLSSLFSLGLVMGTFPAVAHGSGCGCMKNGMAIHWNGACDNADFAAHGCDRNDGGGGGASSNPAAKALGTAIGNKLNEALWGPSDQQKKKDRAAQVRQQQADQQAAEQEAIRQARVRAELARLAEERHQRLTGNLKKWMAQDRVVV